MKSIEEMSGEELVYLERQLIAALVAIWRTTGQKKRIVDEGKETKRPDHYPSSSS